MKKLAMLLIALATQVGAFANDSCCYPESSCCYQECNPFYVKIAGGANFLQTKSEDGIKVDFDPGYLVSGCIGYAWNYGLSLEAEYAYRRNSIDKIHLFGESVDFHGDYRSSSLMGNLIWEIPLCSSLYLWDFRPYIGAGMGYDWQKIHATLVETKFTEKKNHFAWQLLAGISYPVFCNGTLLLEYKFHKGGIEHLYNHSIAVGLQYNFY